MANADFTYTVGFQGDATNLSTTIQNFSAGLKSKPLVVPIAGGNLDVSNTAKLAKIIDSSAQGLQKIVLTTQTFTKSTGESINVITKAVQTFSNGLGQSVEKTKQLANASKLAADGWRKTGDSAKSIIDFKSMNSEYEKANKQLTGMASAAQQFMSKSQNMSGKEVVAAKATAQALIDQKKAFDAAYSSGQFDKMKTAEANIRKLNDQFKVQEAATKRAATGLQGWASTMTNAIKQTLAYTTTLGTMRMAQQLLNEGIQFTIELNKEMVKIQVLQAQGAQTPEEISALAGSFNDLAKQMGVTTVEVAKGSVEWLRQGRSIEETTELLKSSTMLSKLGALESAEATELLTSTVNSYKIAVQDTISVVDKMVAVDNNSATSTREIATALRYTAATAAEAGVSLEQLISYIATMSSVTRINAESIGQSMKTILTRMQDIKAGKIDEDGLGLNNVESALARIDVPLRDSATSFRDLGAVLEDVAAKWDTLNEIEQANISKAIAGVRQANLFKVLMSNMGDALKYQAIEAGAAGTAMDRYAIYLQGVEAAQNELKASVESLWMDAIKSGMITNVLKAITTLVEFTRAAGGLKTAIVAVVAAFALLNWTKIVSGAQTLSTAFQLLTKTGMSLTEVIVGLDAAVLTNPWILLGAAIIGAAYAMWQLSQASANAKKEFDQAASAAINASTEVSNVQKNIDDIQSLWEEYLELKSNIAKTAEEQKRFIDLQNQINSLSGGNLQGYYDAELNFRITDNQDIADTIALLKEELSLRQEIAKGKDIEAAQAADKAASTNQQDIASLKEQIKIQQDWAKNSPIKEVQDRAKQEVASLTLQLRQKELLDQQYVNKAVATYKRLTTEKEKQDFLATLSYEKSINAIIAETVSPKNASKYAGKYQTPKQKAVVVPVKMDDKQFLKQLETAKAKIESVNEAILNIGFGKDMDKNTAVLDEYGIAWDTVNGKVIVNQESTEVWREGINAAGYDAIDFQNNQEQMWDEATSAMYANIEGVQMTKEEYTYLAENISSSMWSAASGAKMALTDLHGNTITSAAQLQSILISSEVEFQNIITQMTKKNMVDLKSLADYAAQILSFFGGSGITPSSAGVFGGGGGGGGGGAAGDDPEIQAQEAKIKRLEKKKQKLEDTLKTFKKWIDAQKESLKLQKEEAEYNDEIAKKNKSLAKLKTQIYLLSLDESQAAKAKRLKLEEEAANLSVEITKKEEDRKYDMQVAALEAYEKKYEESINKQIKAINLLIEKVKELIDALKNAAKANRSVGGPARQLTASEKSGYGWTVMRAAANGTPPPPPPPGWTGHNGGIVETHHSGDFAGNLKTNEVYAKLLKGENVATEGQMDNFMKNILPKIANYSPKTSVQNKVGDTNHISLNLTVNGNLDKVTLKDVQAEVYGAMNKAFKARGKQKNAFTNSI